MLGFFMRVTPRKTARQNLFIFSTHDPDDALNRLSEQDIQKFQHFFREHSSRQGALNDLTHTVGPQLLRSVSQPTLAVHSYSPGRKP